MKTLMTYVIVALAVAIGWIEFHARAVIDPIAEHIFGEEQDE
jgi:hypothetical protein